MSEVIKNIQKEFYHYKALGDRTFEQLDKDQMNWKSSSESSSIGQIVKHMNGNMLSRWTDFLCSARKVGLSFLKSTTTSKMVP